MADTNDQDEKKTGSESAASKPDVLAPPPPGIAPIPHGGVRIGSEPSPLSKGQRKHLRRQKEAGQIKITSRRSQVSR